MQITVPMFEKGRSFLMAGGLVKAYEGHRFVYLHLLSQGVECIAKAILVAQDYERYEPTLRNEFGHDLEKLINEVKDVSSTALLSDEAMIELRKLNSYYKRHMLRYGSSADFEEEAISLAADHLHSELVGWLDEFNEKFSSNA